MNRYFCTALFVCVAAVSFAEEKAALTAQQIIDRIKTKVGVDWAANTVDTIKAGDPQTKITGITTTMFPTMEVLRKAAAEGKNLVVCHEPTFYNHLDQLGPLEKDDVQMAKLKFIKENNLVVFRFHDHWHATRPDGIMTGVVEALGWTARRRKGEQAVYDIETTTVGELAKHVKEKLKAAAVRVVGDPKLPCAKIAMAPGAGGSIKQIALLSREDVDVLICGEAREWETVEYMRDGVNIGQKKALIIAGHSPSEEPGMDNCAKWLAAFIPEVPVKFIPCGDPFWTPEK